MKEKTPAEPGCDLECAKAKTLRSTGVQLKTPVVPVVVVPVIGRVTETHI